MVKRMMRTGVALLAVSSMFAMTAFAADEEIGWNADGGSLQIEGDAWTVDPVIEVELPGDLAFGINPMSLDADEDGTADKQIVSGTYTIANYSNIPVLVETTTKLSGGSDVDILSDADYDDAGDLKKSTDKKKAIWMVQLLPTGATTQEEEGYKLKVTDLTATDTNATAKGLYIGKDDSDAAKALFKLEAGTGETFNPKSVSGFKFAGAVDPNATFTEEDAVKVTTVFKLNTLSANQADNNYETLDTGYDDTVVKVKEATAP